MQQPSARQQYHQSLKTARLGQEPPETAAQRAERERAERNAQLVSMLSQFAPFAGAAGGAAIGALAGGGVPGATLGASIGGAAGTAVGAGGQMAATGMTEKYDRAEAERMERERRRQELLMLAGSMRR